MPGRLKQGKDLLSQGNPRLSEWSLHHKVVKMTRGPSLTGKKKNITSQTVMMLLNWWAFPLKQINRGLFTYSFIQTSVEEIEMMVLYQGAGVHSVFNCSNFIFSA